jgi:hypothetical protein
MKQVLLYLTMIFVMVSIFINGRPMLKKNHPLYEWTKSSNQLNLGTIKAKGYGSKIMKKAMKVEHLKQKAN